MIVRSLPIDVVAPVHADRHIHRPLYVDRCHHAANDFVAFEQSSVDGSSYGALKTYCKNADAAAIIGSMLCLTLMTVGNFVGLMNASSRYSHGMLLSSSSSSNISSADDDDKQVLPEPFDSAVQLAHSLIEAALPDSGPNRSVFDPSKWDKRTSGGLRERDRDYLSRIYGDAESVFEYGLGESTYIADHMGVRRYAGIDSDPAWVALAREKVPDHFRFYFAQIGLTIAWGFPKTAGLCKSILNYQLMPLIVEPQPFDVYMGRWTLEIAMHDCELSTCKCKGSRPQQNNCLATRLHSQGIVESKIRCKVE